MGKRQTGETYKQVQIERRKADEELRRTQAEADERARGIEAAAFGNRGELEGLYRQTYGSPNLPPAMNFSNAGMGNINWNNVDTGNLNDVRQKWGEFAKTGGVDEARRASIMENVAGLKEIGRTGGLTDENIARMRGLGGFEEYAKTGGYTSDDLAKIKLGAITPIGAYATGTQEELARRRGLQGGYAPGFDAANRQLQRDTSRAIADTSLAADIQLKDRVNLGRQWGIGGLSAAESDIARQVVGNKLAGLTGAGGMELQLQDMISRYMAMGLSGEQATSQAIADIELANSQGQMGAGMFNAQMAANLQGQQADYDLARAKLGWEQQAYGMGGLQGLYGMDQQLAQADRDRAMSSIGQRLSYNQGLLGQQATLGMQPGWGTHAINIAGAAAGLGSQIIGANNPGATGFGYGQTRPGVGGIPSYTPIPPIGQGSMSPYVMY